MNQKKNFISYQHNMKNLFIKTMNIKNLIKKN